MSATPVAPPAAVSLFLRRATFGPIDQCWPWTGALTPSGYGLVSARVDGVVTTRSAHVLSHHLFHGPMADGMEVDHLCRNRACVNPTHLEAVTHAENMRRGLEARRSEQAA